MTNKNIFFWVIISNLLLSSLFAEDKSQLINKLNETKTLKFNFMQFTNGIEESGSCILAFPGKLKCIYNDKKGKELIINKKSLAIIQKKYNKIYYYPISKSPFMKILNKKELVNIIKENELNYVGDRIFFLISNKNNQKIKIFFNKINFNLMGWETKDKFHNKISFVTKNILVNEDVSLTEFNIPKEIK